MVLTSTHNSCFRTKLKKYNFSSENCHFYIGRKFSIMHKSVKTCCFSAYSNVSWKRAQPAPLGINKNSAGYRQPVGGATHGRTDWAAK